MSITSRARSGLPLFQRIVKVASPSLTNVEGLRSYSIQAKATEAKVKVPLALFGGSGNYATALFIAASRANAVEKVESEIKDVIAASKKSPLFAGFIKDLSVPRETRVKAITSIFSESGYSEITKNFLAVLAHNGRLKNMELIAKRFIELTMAHKGEVKVVVTTVIPLPAEEEKELALAMKEMLPNAKFIQIEQKIDPSIMGGLVIEFNQKVFDTSIRTRAKQMEKFLREPVDFENV